MSIATRVGMTVTYSFQCSVPECNEVADTSMDLSMGEVLPVPCAPEGWRTLNGLAVCLNHHVRIDDYVTGEEALFMAEGDSHWRKAGEE